jgi:ribonuclease D
MISTQSELLGLIEDLRSVDASVPGFDLEADNLHRYAEQLCLVQVTDGKRFELIDPLAIKNLDPLRDFLVEANIWMHGADFDMTLMRREFGILPKMIFDTQIAARLLGVRKFSYANLVEQNFEVQLSKSSQKENWGQRPLPAKMCEYALNDVRYLLPLAERLEAGLREQGRYTWFLESCEAAMNRVRERDEEREDPWRIQGAGKLDRWGLGCLRILWEWRDREAQEWDRPAFMVARNNLLIDWSLAIAKGGALEFPRNIRARRQRRLELALEKARNLPKSEWPVRPKSRGRRWDDRQEAEYARYAKKRDQVAEELDIDPSILASRAVLERLVWREEEPDRLLLPWQRALLEV